MPTTANFKNLIQYTILAATTAKNIADTAQVPFLHSTATVALSILKGIEMAKSNREENVEIIEQIHEILCIIVQLHSTSEIKGVLPMALLYDIAKFTEELEKLFTVINRQQKGTFGKIKGFFRQPEAAERLDTCKQELSRMVKLFRAQVTDSNWSQMGQMKKDAKEQHELLVALLETHPDLTCSDHSSVAGTLSSLGNSSVSFGLLPPCPQIFHGREAELRDVVNILIQDSARIAILGAGGMGKTSLATTALHNQQVEAKYSHRYFVPCHSIPTCTELSATIADHIGLEKGSNLTKRVAHYFAHAPPSLLVLDNLETCWESLASRSEVEEFLSLLTDVLHLGVIITLRGAERPSKVKWTRPFVAPLEPLSYVAARQTFIEVADDDHDDASIKELLELTGNLPLAVSLIASVAGSEGCAQALSRWKLESTRMLSEGYDQRSSLDISIMLSYTSSRMTAGAQQLLSILSMLPDGLADADLVRAKLPIPDILACKTTLIQTALAFVGQDQHLKVLVPIREHILHTHPPSNSLKLKLREHFHQILDLWNQFKNLNVADIIPQISQNLGNFTDVLRDGLESEGPDIVQNFRSILFLNQFSCRVQDTYSPLLLELSGIMLYWKDHAIFGEYLIHLLQSSDDFPDLDFNSNITLGTQHFQSKGPLEEARWYRALGLYFWSTKSDSVKALKYYQRAHSLAENIGYPTIVGSQVLNSICSILIAIGKPLSALSHAKEAHQYAEHMGDIYLQAWSIWLQGRCHTILANYRHAQHLLQNSRDILAACGQQQSGLGFNILSQQAEIHLLKSEYLESRKLQVAIASSCQPTSHDAILANLNIVCIDIATGADQKIVRQNLDNCKFHGKAFYATRARRICLGADYGAAELRLRDGPHGAAREMFEKCFTQSQDISTEQALLCLERLADYSTGMNSISTTLRWAGVFLSLASKCKDKHQTMQALRCLGKIFSAEGDNETALSVFNVVLAGFTFMDVHRWRADCMVHIGDILNNRGEVMKAVKLWKAARPLFNRSSQMKDIIKIDAKLAEVDSALLDKYKEQLQ
ncbi:hypothetical protein C8J57DRAFT_1723780 [Mycena rebaudengoi]|nr:hypothetical protein C8J57DRAFT_1723780 [Mycena rebaudengoi]